MQAFVRAFSLLLALLTPACGSDDGAGDVGAPCNSDEDCTDGLTCDVHDGRGSCQTPHDD
jgi:hypothetical protein